MIETVNLHRRVVVTPLVPPNSIIYFRWKCLYSVSAIIYAKISTHPYVFHHMLFTSILILISLSIQGRGRWGVYCMAYVNQKPRSVSKMAAKINARNQSKGAVRIMKRHIILWLRLIEGMHLWKLFESWKDKLSCGLD